MDACQKPDVVSYRNTLHFDFKHVGHITEAVRLTVLLGYPYMLWNGRVYRVYKDCDIKTTMIRQSALLR